MMKTQKNSAILKHFLKHELNSDLMEILATEFPLEAAEACDEVLKRVDTCSLGSWVWRQIYSKASE